MRLSLFALAALPVLVGGIAITTAVSVLGPGDAPGPTPDPVLGKSIGDRAARAETAGAVTGPGDDTRGADTRGGTRVGDRIGSGDDTEIDGRRPHLTVIDGRPAVARPGAIPAALSILPPPSVGLPPLADLGGELAWPTGDGDARGRTAPGAGEVDEPGSDDDRWTDASTSSVAEPGSPQRRPGGESPLSAVPGVPSQNEEGAATESAPGARPPAAGRPGRPPSDAINRPFPSVGLPGEEDAGRLPPMSESEPLTPAEDPRTPDADAVIPDAVVPEETAVPDGELDAEGEGGGDVGGDVEGDQPDEASAPTAEAGLDDSQPPVR